jgi:hypothetical protein
VTVRENRILGGAGFGVGLGSVVADGRASLGGMLGLRIEANEIRGLALGGIGVLGFRISQESPDAPVTDDLLISANQIEGCAYGQGVVVEILSVRGVLVGIRMAAAVALWTGENVRLLDNRIEGNGRLGAGDEPAAPHPIGGVLVFQAERGLVISRNQIHDNFSRATDDLDGLATFADGIFARSSSPSGDTLPGCVVADNTVSNLHGSALRCRMEGEIGSAEIVDNHLTGMVVARLGEQGLVIEQAVDVSSTGALLFNSNHVASEFVDRIGDPAVRADVASRLTAKHATVAGNHFVYRGRPLDDCHVLVKGDSATATGNHCLEPEPQERVSLRIESSVGGGTIAAVANVTTSGVQLDPPNPAADLANLVGVPA